MKNKKKSAQFKLSSSFCARGHAFYERTAFDRGHVRAPVEVKPLDGVRQHGRLRAFEK
jgi:hypothetical protein